MTLRSLAKRAYISALRTTGALERSVFSNPEATFVLGLHRVLPTAGRMGANSLPAMILTDVVFVDLLEFATAHFDVIPIEHLLHARNNARRPALAFTFDDGWYDNHDHALPILLRKQVPAAVFISTGYIGSSDTFWVERLCAAWKCGREEQIKAVLGKKDADLSGNVEFLKHMSNAERNSMLQQIDLPAATSGDRLMDWNQVQSLHAAGVAVGTHTVTHPLLTYETEAIRTHELRDAWTSLTAHCQPSIKAFAYPNGDLNAEVRQQVADTGYQLAFTTRPGRFTFGDDQLTVPRYLLHDGNVSRDGRFCPDSFLYTLSRSEA
jgi:peptidoglycan/xylan/chitin deacetylase (PgdA/CDA1 family)